MRGYYNGEELCVVIYLERYSEEEVHHSVWKQMFPEIFPININTFIK